MKLSIQKKIGNSIVNLAFDEKDSTKEAILNASWFMELPEKCGLCGSADIHLRAHKAKGKDDKGREQEFTYAMLSCKECRGRLQFGEFLNPKGALFIKWPWETYTPKQKYNLTNNG